MLGYMSMLVAGLPLACPDTLDTLIVDMRETAPGSLLTAPRMLGPAFSRMTARMEETGGLHRPRKGRIRDHGAVLRDRTPAKAARPKLARTVQNIALFKRMAAPENIMAGRILFTRANFLAVALQRPRARKEGPECREKAEEIVEFPQIRQIRKTPVSRPPRGLQKRAELGRALAAEPEMLLPDAPMAGMNVGEQRDMCRCILDMNDPHGTTMVPIEHDMGGDGHLRPGRRAGSRQEDRRRVARRRPRQPRRNRRLSRRGALRNPRRPWTFFSCSRC